MPLRLLSVWGHTPRPWGYEVRVDFADEAGAIHNEVLTFEKEPDAATLNAAVEARQTALTERIAAEVAAVPEPTPDDLKARVAELEAQTVALVAEREVLVAERGTLLMERDALLAVEPLALDAKVGL